MINPKKYIAVCLGVLMTVYGGVVNLSFVNAQNNSESSTDKMQGSTNIKLVQNANWVNVKRYWKKLNSLDSNKRNNSNFKTLKSLKSQIKDIEQNIESLRNSNLLSQEQSDYLKDFINARVSYLHYAVGMVLCYKMSQTGVQVVKKRADLEDRYDKLEKLFKEDKIDQKTFELTKDKIVEDIKFIDQNTSSTLESSNVDGMTDLLILLNK